MAADDKKPLLDASGSDNVKDDETATAILRRKKKDNGRFTLLCNTLDLTNI